MRVLGDEPVISTQKPIFRSRVVRVFDGSPRCQDFQAPVAGSNVHTAL